MFDFRKCQQRGRTFATDNQHELLSAAVRRRSACSQFTAVLSCYAGGSINSSHLYVVS